MSKITLAVNYLGGYDDRGKSSGILSITDESVVYTVMFRKQFDIQSDEIKRLVVEPPEEVGKRVTATRLIALGVFALFLKKNTKESFVVVELKDGRELIFNVKGVAYRELRAKLSTKAAKYLGQAI